MATNGEARYLKCSARVYDYRPVSRCKRNASNLIPQLVPCTSGGEAQKRGSIVKTVQMPEKRVQATARNWALREVVFTYPAALVTVVNWQAFLGLADSSGPSIHDVLRLIARME
jgi:hypothetical protein